MIVSVHVPKTGGTSFRQILTDEFGSRLLSDYGDWVGFKSPEVDARRVARVEEMRGRREELEAKYDIIHGHFVADKYADLFSRVEFVAFFRDPIQQTVSNYQYLLRNPQIPHPSVKLLHDTRMTLQDYVKWSVEPQKEFIGTITLEAFSMVGLQEQFERSLALFNATFSRRLRAESSMLVNPERNNCEYVVAPELRKLIVSHREADYWLYRRACEIFAHQTARWGL